ncbi:MAG: hypothetical protein ACYS26_11285 [Planctomycetota bacterium]
MERALAGELELAAAAERVAREQIEPAAPEGEALVRLGVVGQEAVHEEAPAPFHRALFGFHGLGRGQEREVLFPLHRIGGPG